MTALTVPVAEATAADPNAVIAVAPGGYHTCALLRDGRVKCWGSSMYGQLGYGDTDNRGDNAGEMGDNLPTVDLGTGLKAKAIWAGFSHTCALLNNSKVKCWGLGDSGQLGYGDTDNRGDNAGEMGDNLPTVDLGTGLKVKEVRAGGSFTCALLTNRTMKCWGWGPHGELGYGDTDARGDNAGEMGNSLPTVDLGTGRTVKSFATATMHTCAVLDNNSVKCWGYNSGGQLGYGTRDSVGGNGDMGDSLPTVDLGTGRTARSVSAGSFGTCAVLDNRSVKCWGMGADSQLGNGSTDNRGDDGGEMGDNLPAVDLGSMAVASIRSGDNHTCAIVNRTHLVCWGWNPYGQLGYGDTDNRGDSAGEMGNNLGYVAVTG